MSDQQAAKSKQQVEAASRSSTASRSSRWTSAAAAPTTAPGAQWTSCSPKAANPPAPRRCPSLLRSSPRGRYCAARAARPPRRRPPARVANLVECGGVWWSVVGVVGRGGAWWGVVGRGGAWWIVPCVPSLARMFLAHNPLRMAPATSPDGSSAVCSLRLSCSHGCGRVGLGGMERVGAAYRPRGQNRGRGRGRGRGQGSGVGFKVQGHGEGQGQEAR